MSPVWFCTFTERHREDVADAQLRAQGFQTLFLQRVRRAHRHGCPWVHSPVFARYVFVSSPDAAWHSIRRTRGVVDLVRAGAEPLAVPERVIAELRSRADPAGVIPPPVIKPGHAYNIVNGSPLAGLILLVDELGGEHAKGWVNGFRVKIKTETIDPEPLMTVVDRARQTRPLDQRRKLRKCAALA
jgi:transcriptional antiterminator RfaH